MSANEESEGRCVVSEKPAFAISSSLSIGHLSLLQAYEDARGKILLSVGL